ncbi:MAG: M3 family oligoendopeptidase [Nitrospirae bacterium]|nr:M3 family oligoendopeptidase [Nitrospirota bacterium]
MSRRSESNKSGIRGGWNLGLLFQGDSDPDIEKRLKEVEKKSYEFINTWKGRRDYLTKPSVLKKALDEYEAWKGRYGTDGDAGYYFWLRTQQDQNDPELKARANKIDELSRKIENDIQFFTMRIARIPLKKQKEMLTHEGLKKYRHFLERLFLEARHLLSEPEEMIMNLKSPTSYANWIKMTSGFLAREERKIKLQDGSRAKRPFSEIASLMNNRKKAVRDSAAGAFNEIMAQYADIAEAEINSVLANKKVDDELRRFTRPDLSRHVGDDIDTEIVDTLIQSVSDRFGIARDYYRLKARLMRVRKLRYHDRNVEYGSVSSSYPYASAAKMILKVFRRLDNAFAEIFERFAQNGQIDIYPGRGRSGGAFCAHHLMSQPTYILLNHTDRLYDVLTLAHELGHGINNELIRERQHALNFGTPTSTAEVASTFMEDFVLEEILKKADDELRLSVMMMKLNDDVSTIFRQVACYRFEQELHQAFRQKGYLSNEEIGRMFQKHMSDYMGDAVEQSRGSENWWIYWSHIRYFFYVYSYAGGLLISKAMQSSVKNDPAFIAKVKEFLSAGLSDSPRNIFNKLGIDIAEKSFWDRGLDEVEALLKETAALAKKMGKI